MSVSWPVQNPPRLLVVTINWNAHDATARLLHSLQAQDGVGFEVAVVDNGSTDGSLEQLRREFPHVQFLALPFNAGFGAGNNVALRQAMDRGIPYVLLINNDAVPEPGALASLAAHLEADSGAGAAGAVVLDDHVETRIQAWGGGRIHPWLGWARHNRSAADPLEFITGAALLLRTEALRQTGLFDERFFLYWEDVDLCFRLRKAGWRLRVSEARIRHAESFTTGRNPRLRSFHSGRSLVLFMNKHERWPRMKSLSAVAFQSLLKLLRGQGAAAMGFWAGLRAGFSVLPQAAPPAAPRP